jgi:Protein of unknown function (DUF3043)
MSEPQSNEGKGRPTPTRREAEAKRPRRSLAPAVNKADRKSLKAQQRKKREELRGAYMRGEERALPTRDKGPARKFARNYVDSRYSVAEFFMPLLMVVLLMSIIPSDGIKVLATLFMYTVIMVSFVDGFLMGRKIKAQVAAKFPEEKLKGLAVYAWLRSTQIRRLRSPSPLVKRGEKFN